MNSFISIDQLLTISLHLSTSTHLSVSLFRCRPIQTFVQLQAYVSGISSAKLKFTSKTINLAELLSFSPVQVRLGVSCINCLIHWFPSSYDLLPHGLFHHRCDHLSLVCSYCSVRMS